MARYVDEDEDVLAKYRIADVDEADDPKYYGFAAVDGSWLIMRETEVPNAFRYCRGDSDYSTNWTGRAGLTYQYLYEVF